MKHVIVCLDGMADDPHPDLGGRTAMAAARTPHLDALAAAGALGRAQTSYAGLPCGSPVANLSILGYDPRRFFPHGRASFEAIAAGIVLRPGDLAFRFNLVTVSDDGRLADFTAGQIESTAATALVRQFRTGEPDLELISGQQYRHCLIVRDAQVDPAELDLSPPHEHQGEPIATMLPRGRTARAEMLAARLRDLMERSCAHIARFNARTPTQATMFWAWSASSTPALPPFVRMHERRAALVCGLDFLRGTAIAADLSTRVVPGATGYIDTDLGAKLAAATAFLDDHDLVYLHINALDEAAHNRDARLKAQLLERIDAEVIGPLHGHLDRCHGRRWRLMVLPDHYTLSHDGTHDPRPVPLVLAGAGVHAGGHRRYDEQAASGARVEIGHQLMARFLSPDPIVWDHVAA